MDYNHIYYTEYDEKIVGESKRDPLGIQPIWSYFGNRVIKNITIVSNDFRGFREVLLCLAICGDYQKRNGGLLKEYILLFEQLFIYSMIEIGDTAGIIGSENGTRLYNARSNKNPYISFNSNETILASEISLGYYGRYKTPLNSMGIIDHSDHIKPLSVDVKCLYGDFYSDVSLAFEKYVKKQRQTYRWKNFEEKGKESLRKAVCGPFRKGEKEFWLNRIRNYNAKEKKKDKLMEECYKLLPEKLSESKYSSWLDFFLNLYSSTNDKKVLDVINLEAYLVCIERVFYDMLNSRTLDDVSLNSSDLDYFRACYDNVKELSLNGSQDMYLRFQEMKKLCNPYGDILRGIYNYHKYVCDKKHCAVWLEIGDDNTIQAFSQDNPKIDSNMNRRNYYAASLQSIKEGISEVENG